MEEDESLWQLLGKPACCLCCYRSLLVCRNSAFPHCRCVSSSVKRQQKVRLDETFGEISLFVWDSNTDQNCVHYCQLDFICWGVLYDHPQLNKHGNIWPALSSCTYWGVVFIVQLDKKRGAIIERPHSHCAFVPYFLLSSAELFIWSPSGKQLTQSGWRGSSAVWFGLMAVWVAMPFSPHK